MPLFSFEGKQPRVADSAYIAPTAQVIGRVRIGKRCYIGHGAILRGDYGSIEIGDETAVEEGVIIHARPEDWTRIGDRVTLGHGAMVHNATIHDGAVIGMRAVVSDFSEVGQGAIVGEMGLVRNGQKVPPDKVALGVPVKVVGDVDERHRPMTRWAKDLYAALSGRYNNGAMVRLPEHRSEGAVLPRLHAIGTIHTPFTVDRKEAGTNKCVTTEAAEPPRQGRGLADPVEGRVELLDGYDEALTDLDTFSHLILLFCFDRSEGFEAKVTPHGQPQARGMFATRTPRRPNPIGMTVVRLLRREGSCLHIAGVDMLDKTPLLDIKPYIPRIDAIVDADPGWARDIEKDR